jgi:outer membrane protein TolC
MQLSVEKPTTSGGVLGFRANTNATRFHPGVFLPANPINPQTRSNAEFSFRQPLLQGRGFGPNLAPIVVARIDTERSFFQLKDSLQEMVRSVIEGYWSLVAARTDRWARTQQVEQARFAYERAMARKRQGFASMAEVAQARLARANFRVGLISAEANVLQREAALLNVLGMPPSAPLRPVPVTPMMTDKIDFDWGSILELAAERRPDLIELKLILEADQQGLLMARNQALPRVDAVMLYRWNGLEGRLPSGATIASAPGQFTDWTLGVNFSVPLGLRQSRAALRQQDLVVARDRANIEQGLHQTTHQLAATIRNLAQDYAQYEALTETRTAARDNLRVQAAEYQTGRIILLNVLQAIANWGDAITSQAQTLAQYNTDLASLERQTGTILESHGIRLFEERFASIGPLGRALPDRCYPGAIGPGPNAAAYPGGTKPSEEALDLESPFVRGQGAPPDRRETLPPPAPPRRTPPIDVGSDGLDLLDQQ